LTDLLTKEGRGLKAQPQLLGPGEYWLKVEIIVIDEGPGMNEGQQKVR